MNFDTLFSKNSYPKKYLKKIWEDQDDPLKKDLNFQSSKGNTILMTFCENFQLNYIKIVDKLIDYTDVNIVNSSNQNALTLLSQNFGSTKKIIDVVQKLIDKTDLNVLDNKGRNFLTSYYFFRYGHNFTIDYSKYKKILNSEKCICESLKYITKKLFYMIIDYIDDTSVFYKICNIYEFPYIFIPFRLGIVWLTDYFIENCWVNTKNKELVHLLCVFQRDKIIQKMLKQDNDPDNQKGSIDFNYVDEKGVTPIEYISGDSTIKEYFKDKFDFSKCYLKFLWSNVLKYQNEYVINKLIRCITPKDLLHDHKDRQNLINRLVDNEYATVLIFNKYKHDYCIMESLMNSVKYRIGDCSISPMCFYLIIFYCEIPFKIDLDFRLIGYITCSYTPGKHIYNGVELLGYDVNYKNSTKCVKKVGFDKPVSILLACLHSLHYHRSWLDMF